MRERPQRFVRDGRHRMRQHADAARRLHQDDGEGARRRRAPDNARIQRFRARSRHFCNRRSNRGQSVVYHRRSRLHSVSTERIHSPRQRRRRRRARSDETPRHSSRRQRSSMARPAGTLEPHQTGRVRRRREKGLPSRHGLDESPEPHSFPADAQVQRSRQHRHHRLRPARPRSELGLASKERGVVRDPQPASDSEDGGGRKGVRQHVPAASGALGRDVRGAVDLFAPRTGCRLL